MELDKPARNDVIRELLAELEAHVPGERRHSDRVAVYAVAVGEKLGLSGLELENLAFSAQLHDIGKLKVPAIHLVKGEALTASEREVVECHPELAREVLRPHPWLFACLPGITSHHERFDGMGYPENLKGTTIPLAARIIAVCEAFDVYAFGVYLPARGQQGALKMLRDEAGRAFDPGVVSAFEEIEGLINPMD